MKEPKKKLINLEVQCNTRGKQKLNEVRTKIWNEVK
jgi:hypothetical protein